MSRSTGDFFRDCLAAVPELGQVYREHLELNEELLGYVALGDMTQHVLRHYLDPYTQDTDLFRRYTAFLEAAFDRYGDTGRDMILQSFLEFVENFSEGDPQAYTMIYTMLGPKLRVAIWTPPPADVLPPRPVVGTATGMTEAAWLNGTDPQPMLELLRGKVSDRKLRLFAVACCRRVWHLLEDKRSRRAVETAEAYAAGKRTISQMEKQYRAASTAAERTFQQLCSGPRNDYLVRAARAVADAVRTYPPEAAEHIFAATQASAGLAASTAEGEQHFQAPLLRDVVGNPFRPVTVDPVSITSTVTNLAGAAYEECALPSGELDPDRLAVLADALGDAGCSSDLLLEHLRAPGPHVRGCWVLDLILAKDR
jgi:hypothetical protein